MVKIMFSTVAIMFVYMFLGYGICKSKKAVVSHAKSLSSILIYILGPAMIINSFLNLEYSKEGLINIGKYFLVALLAQLLFFAILAAIFHKKYDDSKYRILSIGSVLGNVGFIGMPLIASVFPDEPIVLCYSSINVMAMNLIVFTIGECMITNDKSYISIKSALTNPTSLSLVIALPMYILGLHFPAELESGIALLGKMVTPVCMIVLGMRLSEANIKEIFTRKFVYATCALKLIAFPVFAFCLVHWIPFLDSTLKTTIVVLAMAPSGAIIESLAEIHECEQDLAANVVLLTTLLSIITIPVMAYILV